MIRSLSALSGVILILSGCAAPSVQDAVPAFLLAPTAESRDELVRVVSEALDRTHVALADDALTRDSLLVIERRPLLDARGRRVMGRELARPERFQLLKSGRRCYLMHLPEGRHWVLSKATCVVPAPSS